MPSFIDLTGLSFGRFTVLSRAENNERGQGRFLCRCSCGNERVVLSRNLKNGTSQSCGCYRDEQAKENLPPAKHGYEGSPTYVSWQHMKSRITDIKHRSYHRYGGRGIKVCDRWVHSFENFLADMGERPDGFTLERKNNDGDYEPENCKWATRKEQSKNRTSAWPQRRKNKMNDKIKEQIRAVLRGEAKLEEAAQGVHLSVDHVEQRIREVTSRGIIFSGDYLDDLILAGYWRGRSDQFIASMVHLFGEEEFLVLYNQVCLELGISPKRLN